MECNIHTCILACMDYISYTRIVKNGSDSWGPSKHHPGYAALEKKVAEALDVAGGGVASDNKAPDSVVTSEIVKGDMLPISSSRSWIV